ncbi:cholinesterase 1-like [Ixodes scapularis]
MLLLQLHNLTSNRRNSSKLHGSDSSTVRHKPHGDYNLIMQSSLQLPAQKTINRCPCEDNSEQPASLRLHIENEIVDWADVVKLYHSTHEMRLRLAPKLTERHIYQKPFSNMKAKRGDPGIECISDYLRKFAEELEHKSLKSKQLFRSAWREFLGKFFFDCPLEYWAQNLTSASKLHLFRFRHRPRRNTEKVTVRNDDLELVFGRPLTTGVTGTMSNLSKKVIDFWSYFARTGSLPAVSKAVQWPQFRSKSPARIEVFDTGFVTYRVGVSESCRQLMPLIYPRVHGWDTKTAARPGAFTFLGERHGR